MIVGKIIHSNAHNDYVCQVYQKDEVENPPAREDHALGNFVQIRLDDARALVGLVYDTRLFNPEFGRLGPRLSPEADLAVFSPDVLNEQATLVGIAAIGALDGDAVTQGLPSLAANVGSLVETMTDDAVRAFHRAGDSPRLAYVPILLASGAPHTAHLLGAVLERLTALLPEHTELLTLLGDDLRWRASVTPLGVER